MTYTPQFDSSIHATQDLMQVNAVKATANGPVFRDGVHATNHSSQSGQNHIVVR